MPKNRTTIAQLSRQWVEQSSNDLHSKLQVIAQKANTSVINVAIALGISEEEVRRIQMCEPVSTETLAKILIATDHMLAITPLPASMVDDGFKPRHIMPSSEAIPSSPFASMGVEKMKDIIRKHLWDTELDINHASREELVDFLTEKDRKIKSLKNPSADVEADEDDNGLSKLKDLLDKRAKPTDTASSGFHFHSPRFMGGEDTIERTKHALKEKMQKSPHLTELLAELFE